MGRGESGAVRPGCMVRRGSRGRTQESNPYLCSWRVSAAFTESTRRVGSVARARKEVWDVMADTQELAAVSALGRVAAVCTCMHVCVPCSCKFLGLSLIHHRPCSPAQPSPPPNRHELRAPPTAGWDAPWGPGAQ